MKITIYKTQVIALSIRGPSRCKAIKLFLGTVSVIVEKTEILIKTIVLIGPGRANGSSIQS